MDDNERTLRIEEFKKLKEQLISEMSINDNNGSTISSEQSNNKVMSLNNGHYKESNQIDYNDRKAGMVNVLLLSIFSFIFECLFIFLSFILFK